jgi:APA family basic amino acid/polyamine antiporter
VVTGLGSILGTGAFVSIGLAAEMWGDVVLFAIPLAAGVAVFNGLSSAFLAGRYPVAGGTYEYGYRALNPWLGFAAGWLFILAKTASAASAALGVALYLGLEGYLFPIGVVAALTALVVLGLRRTTVVNTILVTVTIAAIARFAVSGVLAGPSRPLRLDSRAFGASLPAAMAFLFVAYTGYGRIATLGEEVRRPKAVIPRAVVVTLAVAATLYLAIEIGGRSLGGENWGELIRLGFIDDPVVRLGAVTAMIGVLLNLILGLSRVWLAMGRRGDMPPSLGRLDRRHQPVAAILISGALVAVVTLIGDIALAWSFSATTVLLYYGLTNLAVLSVRRDRATAWAGLVSCGLLSFFVPLTVWATAAALVLAGLIWKLTRGLPGSNRHPD